MLSNLCDNEDDKEGMTFLARCITNPYGPIGAFRGNPRMYRVFSTSEEDLVIESTSDERQDNALVVYLNPHGDDFAYETPLTGLYHTREIARNRAGFIVNSTARTGREGIEPIDLKFSRFGIEITLLSQGQARSATLTSLSYANDEFQSSAIKRRVAGLMFMNQAHRENGTRQEIHQFHHVERLGPPYALVITSAINFVEPARESFKAYLLVGRYIVYPVDVLDSCGVFPGGSNLIDFELPLGKFHPGTSGFLTDRRPREAHQLLSDIHLLQSAGILAGAEDCETYFDLAVRLGIPSVTGTHLRVVPPKN